MQILNIDKLVVKYGHIKALKGISLSVSENEIVTLIGSNGAGKTTTMKAIMGLVKASEGCMYYNDENITHMETKEKVKKGIVLCPEGRQIFPKFTVSDNLIMGAYCRPHTEISESMDMVLSLFPRLKERLEQLGGTLSGGEQQMLAIARSMMTKPKLLLLDEPSLGLAPLIVMEVFHLIQKIRSTGTTILLVEQNARMALKISDRAYVLETGKIIMDDVASNLLESEKVKDIYLGG